MCFEGIVFRLNFFRLKTKQVTLTKDKRTLCKCLCDRNVTNNDLLEAIQHIKRNKANRY